MVSYLNKLKVHFIFVIFITFNLPLSSKNCLPNGWTFMNQDQIDNFALDYPDCIKVGGPITIVGDDITNLDGLNQIVEVQGDLIIASYSLEKLEDFTGLENLTKIVGDFIVGKFYISNAPSLTSFNGLSNLTTIEGDFIVAGCSALESFNGLDKLEYIGGQFLINNNDALKVLSESSTINYIGTDLIIVSNDSLQHLNGLENLTEINNDLIIGGHGGINNKSNLLLQDLEGLNGLQSIGHDFVIDSNPSLKTLSGIEKLTQITNDFTITYCDSLDNIANTAGIKSIGNNFIFDSNPSAKNFLGFERLESIGTFFKIVSCQSIMNLDGLDSLTSLNIFDIIGANSLTSLEGLDNIKELGSLFITNTKLSNIESLEGLNRIEKSLTLEYCDSLKSLKGLQNIKSIGSNFTLESGINIEDATALNNLEFIGGDFELLFCAGIVVDNLINLRSVNKSLRINGCTIENLDGLEALTYVGEEIEINYNYYLTNIDGIGNVDPNYIDNIIIKNNHNLLNCNIQNICEYMQTPDNEISISSNGIGCASYSEVLEACDSLSSTCLQDGITFMTQEQIDNFIINNPTCSTILGDVIIEGNEINNLLLLKNIENIKGNLQIENNHKLLSLDGLDYVSNISNNIIIKNNPKLNDIEAVKSVDVTDLDSLIIQNNTSLTKCDIESVCSFISMIPDNTIIENNSLGCNSDTEIINSCSNAISVEKLTNDIIIYPNPANSTIFIRNKENIPIKSIVIFNKYGQTIITIKNTSKKVDVAYLNNGLYFIKVVTDDSYFIKKLIIN